VIAGGDLDGCYGGLSGEVRDVGLLVTLESDAYGTGVCSRIALDGGTLEVDLSSGWSG